MSVNLENYNKISAELKEKQVSLVAVSKFKTEEDIMELYNLGQRDFGENFVQELLLKQETLPKDIRWHFIGHLQSNKVKYIAPFIYLIHGVDSEKLLGEINRQATKLNRNLNCLLQVFIADEKTKFGFSADEINQLDPLKYPNVNIKGFMGMASFSDDSAKVKAEFRSLKNLADGNEDLITEKNAALISIGMSGDYEAAIDEGSSMVRIGSLIFGSRGAH